MRASFTHHNATVTCRMATVEDELDIEFVLYAIPDENTHRSRYKRQEFSRCVILSTVDGDLGFPWPSPDDDAAALLEGFSAWKSEGAVLLTKWREALERANTGPNDPVLQPGGETAKN